jgi:hypothetical protein
MKSPPRWLVWVGMSAAALLCLEHLAILRALYRAEPDRFWSRDYVCGWSFFLLPCLCGMTAVLCASPSRRATWIIVVLVCCCVWLCWQSSLDALNYVPVPETPDGPRLAHPMWLSLGLVLQPCLLLPPLGIAAFYSFLLVTLPRYLRKPAPEQDG